jgi:hypothetical protein
MSIQDDRIQPKNETKHTPGTWDREPEMEFEEERPNWRITDKDGNEIATVYAGWAEEHSEANARLISAAPELLATLEKVMRWVDSHPRKATIVQSVKEEAWAALAKAAGATTG